MKQDVEYILKTLSEILGIPARLYENGKKVFYYSLVRLPADPILLNEEMVLEKKDAIGFILDDYSFYYCYLNIEDQQIVLGPILSQSNSRQFLKLCALHLSLSVKEIDEFIDGMNLLSPINYLTVIQTMILVFYFLTDKKMDLRASLVEEVKKANVDKKMNQDNAISHNSYQVEKDILSIVRNGDVDKIDRFVDSMPYFTSGRLSKDSLRQLKNTFVVTATLISRTAIEEGMDVNDSLSLSDFYIQKVDSLESEKDIAVLNYKMVKDYTERIYEIKNLSPLCYQIKRYVEYHLDESIKIENLTQALSIPKSTLYRRFKKENSMSVDDYINQIKIEKSKELLLSDSSLAAIAYCLGYSSQSHFTNMFKKVTNITPSEYKNQNQK